MGRSCWAFTAQPPSCLLGASNCTAPGMAVLTRLHGCMLQEVEPEAVMLFINDLYYKYDQLAESLGMYKASDVLVDWSKLQAVHEQKQAASQHATKHVSSACCSSQLETVGACCREELCTCFACWPSIAF